MSRVVLNTLPVRSMTSQARDRGRDSAYCLPDIDVAVIVRRFAFLL